jgi:hypothetical protein
MQLVSKTEEPIIDKSGLDKCHRAFNVPHGIGTRSIMDECSCASGYLNFWQKMRKIYVQKNERL